MVRYSLRTQQEFLPVMNQVSNFAQRLETFLAYRGDKNVCEFYRGLAKASITAVLACCAFGMCPPMLRYFYTRIPAEIRRRFSEDGG